MNLGYAHTIFTCCDCQLPIYFDVDVTMPDNTLR